MPKPQQGESRDDFIERCIPIVIDDGSAENPDQAFAVCNSLWENRTVTVHEKLLKAIRERRDRKSEFGYGLTTADQYVRKAFNECGAGLTCRAFDSSGSVDSVIKAAAEKLAYANPDMVLEKQTSNASNFGEILPEGVEVPANTLMVLRHTVTTPREDRDRDVLVTDGAALDPKAPLLWQHMHTLPLGKVVTTLEHTPERLRVASALIDLNELTADAAKLIEADALRFSHGFRALEFEERKAEDESGMFPGFRITKFEIMEVSLVSVPSNVDAEMELFSRGKLDSEFFKAHAKHYLAERPVQVPGMELSTPGTSLKLTLGGAELELTTGDDLTAKAQTSNKAPTAAACGCESKQAADHAEKAMVGETGETNGHTHTVSLDENGNGKTNAAAGHSHTVEEYKVAESEGHTHSLSKGSLEDDGKSEAPDGEKRGRVISAKNLKILKDVRDDLKELRGMDLPRKADALCERCYGKLEGVIKAAEMGSDEDEEDKRSPAELTPKEAARLVLESGDLDLLRQFRRAVDAMLETAELDEKASRYRELVKS